MQTARLRFQSSDSSKSSIIVHGYLGSKVVYDETTQKSDQRERALWMLMTQQFLARQLERGNRGSEGFNRWQHATLELKGITCSHGNTDSVGAEALQVLCYAYLYVQEDSIPVALALGPVNYSMIMYAYNLNI